MARALKSLASIGTAIVLLSACGDDPISPDGTSAAARVALSDAPSNLVVSAASPTGMDLRWTDNSRNESGFEIYRLETGTPGAIYARLVQTAQNATAYNDRTVTPSTEYCYKVRWVRKTGKTTTSAFTEPSCAYTLGRPPTPTNVLAVPGFLEGIISIHVSWTQPSPNATGYRVDRVEPPEGEWTKVGETGWTWHRDPYRPIETEACYRITSLNATYGDSPPSDPVCTAPPARPVNLAATAIAAQNIELTWQNASRFADGYEVFRGPNDWNLVLVATLPPEATSYRDLGLAEGRYYYRVRARNDGGFSQFTEPVAALSSLTPPTTSPAIDVRVEGSRSVSINWNPQAANVDGYIIDRSVNDGVSWELAGKVGAFQGNFWEAGRDPEQRVCYRLTAYNGVGSATPSNVDCVTPPGIVADLHASPAGNGAVDLRWTDPSTVNTDYVIQYFTTVCGYYYCYDDWYYYTAIGDVTTFRVEGLDPYTFHQFRLVTVTPDGNSEPSEPAGSYTTSPPRAPSDLSAAVIATSRVDLRWTDNSTDETGFIVYRCQGNADVCDNPNYSGYSEHLFLEANAVEASDTSVEPGATYYYRVLAYTPYMGSEGSNRVSVTIPASQPE